MPQHTHRELHAAAERDAVREAGDLLREHGERMTASRRAVLSALAKHSEPLSAENVVALVEHAGVHRSTVYRTLDLFVAMGFVSTNRAIGAARRYHLIAVGPGSEHLHGHCDGCGTVVPLPLDVLDPTILRQGSDDAFAIDPRLSVLIGRCRACRDGDR